LIDATQDVLISEGAFLPQRCRKEDR